MDNKMDNNYTIRWKTKTGQDADGDMELFTDV